MTDLARFEELVPLDHGLSVVVTLRADHSPHFWSEVRKLVKDDKPPRAWLRAHGQRLHADDPAYLSGEYSPTTAYARSKRAQVELLPILAQRWTPEGVVVDGNHPLAGKNLNFKVEIVGVRAATEEELSHGHVHGPGGHHH